MKQPAAEGNTVCFIIKLLRINFIKWFQLTVFQNLRMKICHTIYTISIVHINMRHMYSVLFINNCNCLIRIFFLCLIIQNMNDRKKLWHNLLKIRNRPFFQCFRKNCVICISTCFSHNFHSFFNTDATDEKQTDQLRDHHCRMGIVDLDCRIIRQIMKITSPCLTFLQNELCSG